MPAESSSSFRWPWGRTSLPRRQAAVSAFDPILQEPAAQICWICASLAEITFRSLPSAGFLAPALPSLTGLRCRSSSAGTEVLCAMNRARSSFPVLSGGGFRFGGLALSADHCLHYGVFFPSKGMFGVGVTGGAVTPFKMSTAAGGSGLSALAKRRLTCHIWVSLRTSL